MPKNIVITDELHAQLFQDREDMRAKQGRILFIQDVLEAHRTDAELYWRVVKYLSENHREVYLKVMDTITP